ncbi:hypothetical protein ACLK16_20115 [Escherichia coli]
MDEFEFAIRTVLEPIFEKPLSEISFGHVLLNLFNTARRFNMAVQPQLVLLQKTLLYVEGLGRQLYPQLDLWQTAKPYLENWMHEQVGPKAVWNAIKEKAPFWAEKLPELPELVYETLRQDPSSSSATLDQMFADFRRHSRRQGQARYLLGVGASLLLVGVFLLTQKQHIDGDKSAWLVPDFMLAAGLVQGPFTLIACLHTSSAPSLEKIACWYQYRARQ